MDSNTPTDNQTSPRRLGTNMLNQQFLAPSRRESSFQLIKQELEDKILYDDDSVFQRLGIHHAPSDFVEACADSVTRNCGDKIKTLQELCKRAEGKDENVLENEEKQDAAEVETSGNHGSKEEKLMYGPLEFLFTHITDFIRPGQPQDPPQRAFRMTKGSLKAEEPQTFGIASVSPDFTGVKSTAALGSKLWGDREIFGEVKPSSKQGPKGSKSSTVRPIVVQCANYARLFMTARPFMLFCTGLLIFGTKFCVGIFDRDGVIFSPIHDMFDDLKVFVDVIHTLTCRASLTQLGFDPSVELLSIERTRVLTSDPDSKAVLQSLKIGQLDYPSALVAVRTVAGAPYTYCTIGYPIWSSQSLLGRGTNVWHVRLYKNSAGALDGPLMVMKTSWRHSERPSESEVYEHVSNMVASIPGLAKFECGGDVVFPASTRVISVRNLRTLLDVPSGQSTPTLHRLVLKSVGRSMWEYDSDSQLLRAFRDVIRAHQFMCDKGILHRDVSPGNMLLTIDQTDNIHGLLCDIELARILTPNIHTMSVTNEVLDESQTRQHIRFDVPTRVKRGAPMTGTAQFMARALLMRKANKHEAEHDIESFIWAFSYCVWRKLWQCIQDRQDRIPEIKDQKEQFRQLFNPLFTQTEPIMIASYRHSASYAIIFVDADEIKDIVGNFMSKPLITLFYRFPLMIQNSQPIRGGTQVPLTHDALLRVVDEAISSF